jgi:hypothetical protein
LRCTLGELGDVSVVPVGDRRSKKAAVWNSLIETYHYLGRGGACGARLRYLVMSSRYGALGGLCFSAAARRLACRDQWIGWCDEDRAAHLDLVVCNSRFLIRPEVTVPNLASRVLALCCRRLRTDWSQRYGYAPLLLETFVDATRFQGTCYRAANWVELGQTAGRGRQDRGHKHAVPAKTLFVYPLLKNWRDRLPMTKPSEPSSESVPGSWAEQELGGSDLGDARLTRRAVVLAESFFDHPGENIPEACGSLAAAKAAYRFFENESVTMNSLLDAHRAETQKRMAEHSVVLAVQDTTSLNYTGRPCMGGLGSISHNQRRSGGGAVGLKVHDTLAFSSAGVPLGVLDVRCWARKPRRGKQADRNRVPIQQKESYVWLQSYQTASKLQSQLPETQVISIGDRDADIYELFAEKAALPSGAELLIRSARSRKRNSSEGYVWDWVPKKAPDGSVDVTVNAKGGRKARTAALAVRFTQLELVPPQRKATLENITAWAVHVVETDPPRGLKTPLEWLLLTTVPVRSEADAVRCTQWYSKRWGIEVYHRTLKSGCRIENRQLGHAEGIKRCLAIDMVVAWRVFFLVQQSRQTPDVPCSVFFEDDEWKALICVKDGPEAIPSKPPTLRNMARRVAALGGFLGRKGDGNPGATVTWRGLQRLTDITATYRAISRAPPCTVQ